MSIAIQDPRLGDITTLANPDVVEALVDARKKPGEIRSKLQSLRSFVCSHYVSFNFTPAYQ